MDPAESKADVLVVFSQDSSGNDMDIQRQYIAYVFITLFYNHFNIFIWYIESLISLRLFHK